MMVQTFPNGITCQLTSTQWTMSAEVWQRKFRGPAFLWEDKSSWSINPMSLAKMSDEDLEVRRRGQTNHLTQMEEKRQLDRYFSWYKFKRAIAWLLRFVKSLKGRRCLRVSSPVDVSSCGRLSIGELRYAEAQIIKYVQKQPSYQWLRHCKM